MADETSTYYFVEERTGKLEKDENGNDKKDVNGQPLWEGRQYLTSDLSRLFRKFAPFFVDQEDWFRAVIDNPAAQKMGAFSLRVATDDDLQAYAEDIAVFEAIQRFKDADKVAARIKAESRETVVGWFVEHVRSESDVDDFFLLHKNINPWLFASWVKEWEHHTVDGNVKNPMPEVPRAALKAYNESQKNSKSTKAGPKGTAKQKTEQLEATRVLAES